MATHTIVAPPESASLPGGLFSILTFRNEGRWTEGVTWPDQSCGTLQTASSSICDPDDQLSEDGLPEGWPLDDGADNGASWATARGVFDVYATHSCSPVGTSVEQMNERALANLYAHEEQTVEARFWRAIGQGATVLNDGAPVDLKVGVGALEQTMWQTYGSGGSIHVPRAIATKLGARLTGQRLTTPIGTPVVAGNYGDVDLTNGIYTITAVPPMVAYRSEAGILGDPEYSFDTRQNNVTATANRIYLIGWGSCPVYSIQIDLSL